MFYKKPEDPVCGIIGAPCPETNDPNSALAKSCNKFCNFWVDGIAETHTDGSGRFTQETYKGCFLKKLPAYLVSIACHANHAGASADKAATESHRASVAVTRMFGGLTLAAQAKQKELSDGEGRQDKR